MTTTSVTLDMEVVTCPTEACGVTFAVPSRLVSDRRSLGGKAGQALCCPHGHPIFWNDGERQRLEKENARLVAEAARERESRERHQRYLTQEREAHELTTRKLRGTKSYLSGLKRRVGGGACPCCKRTFQQLARHMKTKHPEFAGSEP